MQKEALNEQLDVNDDHYPDLQADQEAAPEAIDQVKDKKPDAPGLQKDSRKNNKHKKAVYSLIIRLRDFAKNHRLITSISVTSVVLYSLYRWFK